MRVLVLGFWTLAFGLWSLGFRASLKTRMFRRTKAEGQDLTPKTKTKGQRPKAKDQDQDQSPKPEDPSLDIPFAVQ
jgi:hypothetical protein